MKRSKLLLIAGILGTAYTLYLVFYFTNAVASSSSDTQALGAGIAAYLVMPHALLTALGTLFAWIGYGCKARWAALTAGILYAVAIAAFPMYFFFVIAEMILCFIAFAKMKKSPSIS